MKFKNKNRMWMGYKKKKFFFSDVCMCCFLNAIQQTEIMTIKFDRFNDEHLYLIFKAEFRFVLIKCVNVHAHVCPCMHMCVWMRALYVYVFLNMRDILASHSEHFIIFVCCFVGLFFLFFSFASFSSSFLCFFFRSLVSFLLLWTFLLEISVARSVSIFIFSTRKNCSSFFFVSLTRSLSPSAAYFVSFYPSN